MRAHLPSFAALVAATLATSALAQDPAAPAPAFTISGGATIISDYRFRGLSQTNKRFAVQGTININHESGLYVGTWGSSIDDYVAAGSDQEIDIYGGYKKTVNGTTFDVGALYYYYPGGGNVTTDFLEPYASVSHTFGPATAKVGAAYAYKQHAQSCTYDPRCGGDSREDNLYVYGELGGAIPNTGFSVSSHLGYSHGRSYLTNGLKGYLDWNVGVAYAWKNLTLGVSYVDTDAEFGEFTNGGKSNRNPAKAGVVVSLGATF